MHVDSAFSSGEKDGNEWRPVDGDVGRVAGAAFRFFL